MILRSRTFWRKRDESASSCLTRYARHFVVFIVPLLASCTNAISAKFSNASTDVVLSASTVRTFTVGVEINRPVDSQKSTEPGAENSGNNPDVIIPIIFSGEVVKDTEYTVSGTQFVIPYGQTRAEITITITEDFLNGPTQQIIMTMGSINIPKVKWAGPSAFTITLLDDWPQPKFDLTVASQSLNENCGTASITAVLSRPSEYEINVPYTLSGSAISPNHHNLSAGSFVFEPGTTTDTITFNVIDEEFNYDHTLVVTAGTPDHAASGTITSQSILLMNNKPAPIVDLTTATQTVNETVGTVTVTVTQDRISLLDTIIPFTVTGTAVNPSNHNLASGTLTITAGQLSGSTTFNAVNDNRYDISKTVIITLHDINAGTAGTVIVQTITIQNVNPPPVITFSALNQTVVEPTSPGTLSVSFTATLDTLSNLDASVTMAVGGDSAPTQHNLAPQLITVTAGTLTSTITFTLFDDSLDEPARTLTGIMGVPANCTVGGIPVHTVNITDSNPPSVATFASATMNTPQSVGPVTMRLTSNVSAYDVTVPYTIGGTAVFGVDHNLANGSFLIGAGYTFQDVTFNVIGDSNVGVNKTIVVTLGAPTNATLGANSVLTITLEHLLARARFSIRTQDVAESFGEETVVKVPIELTSPIARDAIIPFTLSGSTVSSIDSLVSSGQVTIPAGATSANATVTFRNEKRVWGDKTRTLIMGVPTNAAKGSLDQHTITLLDGRRFAPNAFLKLWLTADHGITKDAQSHVLEWRDRSNQKRHLSEVKSWAQPIHDPPGIRFTDSDHQLTTSVPFGKEALSWFSVYDKKAAPEPGPTLELTIPRTEAKKMHAFRAVPPSIKEWTRQCFDSIDFASALTASVFDIPLLRELGVLKLKLMKTPPVKLGIMELAAYDSRMPVKDVFGLIRFLAAKYHINQISCSLEDVE